MAWIAGGAFLMGSDRFYREERPIHRESVDGFWIDRYLVTNRAFARFVEATGYVTMAERRPDPTLYPDADPSLLVPGSSVFRKPPGPVPLGDYRMWWAYVPSADWRHPEGPDSDISSRMDHPVVHVGYHDALAYAAWAGKALPTEAEWEFAARGGLDGAAYAWGDEPMPGGRIMANTWQGRFPWENLAEDGYEGTSPVGAFPANGYGLFDMIGNVWEWTDSPVTPHAPVKHACCSPDDTDPRATRRVVKGGSHLCAPNYCLRYRPPARQAEPIDTSTSHIGFRCIIRDPR
ncbi:MAG TPA: formylglycine-generating enzyme family protein [Rhodopila sp.]|uniref:formylglycine-generating enzyme family protein n=1 Tax=Rhodopila sp. TaxID=2480087 RepID=UPI002CD2DD7C|nr:formylglycine-generating enzyme family protein [Rhodopila sp.]HVY17077.1 formylglycine-generating enzyme family protein [Rhodopila sp.]